MKLKVGVNFKYILTLIIELILIICAIIFFAYHKNQHTNITKNEKIAALINIKDYPKKKLDNYIKEVQSLHNSDDIENTLIVISEKKLKEGYGAKKIIDSPNNQYILVYDSKEKMNRAKLKLSSSVISVEQNIKYSFSDNNSSSSGYNSWGVEKMGLDKIIAKSKTEDFDKVVVAVLDSGCDIDIFNKYYPGKLDGFKNIIDNRNIMYDNNGHGTHVAGTIAEATSDNVKILPVKQTDSSSIYLTDNLASLNWIIYNDKADVINMSFGSVYASYAMYQLLTACKDNNIIPVAAAGNDNRNINNYPASYDNTISIGAVNNNLERAPFSNFGNTISFVAPGANIKSIMGDNTANSIMLGNSNIKDDYEYLDGTSMACPHAVAAVAMLKSYNVDMSYEDVFELLKENAIDLGAAGKDEQFGYGFISFNEDNLCDGSNCEKNNIFKDSAVKEFPFYDFGDDVYEAKYNYGNNMNLYNMGVKYYYAKDKYLEKKLGEIETAEISNFDANKSGIQNITIKIGNQIYKKNVNNLLVDGWKYSDYNLNTIELNGFISDDAFVEYVEIPDYYNNKKIESYSYNAFSDTKIKTFKFNKYIKHLEASSFVNCIDLYKIELNDNFTSIPDSAFFFTSSLSSISIPNSVNEIKTSAFASSGLKSITIPASVKKIETGSFSNSNIEKIVFEDGISEIKAGSFKEMPYLQELYIPKSVTNIEYNAFGDSTQINNISIDSDNPKYVNINNSQTIVDKDKNELLYAGENSIIPESITSIAPYSLASINEYIIPSHITTLKDYALYNCPLAIIPNSIKNIESSSAFYINDNKYTDTYYFVHKDSFVHNYLATNNLPYLLLESEKIELDLKKSDYNAFEKISYDDFYMSIVYSGSENKEFAINLNSFPYVYPSILYQNETDHFVAGDEYYSVVYYDILNNKKQEKIKVNVNKIDPTYDIPSNLTGIVGKKLNTIKLPDGFSWYDGSEIIKAGKNNYTVIYTPKDSINYNSIKDINVNVLGKINKNVIVPKISVNDKQYDGTKKINLNDIIIDEEQKDIIKIKNATLKSENIGIIDAEITVKILDDKIKDYAFENNSEEITIAVPVRVNPIILPKVKLKDIKYTYNGVKQTVQLENFDPEKMIIKNNSRINAGDQIVNISLNNPNYVWDDNTNNDINLVFKIEKAKPHIDLIYSPVNVKYDGSEKSLKIESSTKATIKYMDNEGNYTLDSSPKYTDIGDYKINYKISMNDNKNYEDLYGEKTLSIREKLIDYSIDYYSGLYDNEEHSINLKVNSSNYTIKYSLDGKDFNLDSLPKFKNIGEHEVKFKITSNNTEDIIDSGKVYIYGVNSNDSSVVITGDTIKTNDKSLSSIISKLDRYPSHNKIIHLNANNDEIDDDGVKDGDYIVINLNDKYNLKYKVCNINFSNDSDKTIDDKNTSGEKNNNSNIVVEVGDTSKENSILLFIVSIILIITGFGVVYKMCIKK